jgi:signal transduction histidine kinase
MKPESEIEVPVLPSDPNELREALLDEILERRHAECLAKVQTDAAQLTLNLLAREPESVESFFGMFTKTLVDECESEACDVWLLDEDEHRAELWMTYQRGALHTPGSPGWDDVARSRDSMARHLFTHIPGWMGAVVYQGEDPRLSAPIRDEIRRSAIDTIQTAPLVLGSRILGWIVLASGPGNECPEWRLAMLEAIARQATFVLHVGRLAERGRLEEREKATLEERNRLARDIHDNLAQGFAAILMQLQGALRGARELPAAVRSSLDNAVVLARTHLTEARRSVSSLRPNIGDGESVGAALERLADMGQRTTDVPIAVVMDELPRFGDPVEREIVAIAQEALTNAVRHADAQHITIRASTVNSIGLRLSVADDGRGIPRGRGSSGFGMTSMRERADRIGASLTIVTAPRSGTEVVLAWEPTSLPTQVHLAG